MNWTEEDLLARGNRYLEDQRAERERLATARGLHDALAEMKQDERMMTCPVEAKPAKTRKPRKCPERDIEKACSDLLQYDGWRLLKTDPCSDRRRGKGFGEIGMADCLYIRYNTGSPPQAKPQDAQVLWCEWKAPGGKPSPHQRAWIAAERSRGALVWLCGADFLASVEGFLAHYRSSGLMSEKAMMYSGDEDYDDDVTSGIGHQPEPDDFDEYNRNEADDYRDED